jgi:hypothetical protein
MNCILELTVEDILEHTGYTMEEFMHEYPELIPEQEPAYASYK